MSVSVFFCYAREDSFFLDKLKPHLMPLQRQGLIDFWHDRDINAGAESEQEISQHLNTADIILLMISSDFMNSDYCYGIEMKRAIERQKCGEAKVIPVILRHVYWQGEPFGKFQALPTNGIPVTDPFWINLDKAFYSIAEGIREIIRTMNTEQKDGFHEEFQGSFKVSTLRQPTRNSQSPNRYLHILGFLDGVAIQVADFSWLILILQQGPNNKPLWNTNTTVNMFAACSFIFMICTLIITVSVILVHLARQKQRRWFIGLLIGSICGSAVIFFPGIALIIYGIAGLSNLRKPSTQF